MNDKKYEMDIAFWTGYYNDDDEDYFSWASNKAYLDMNRTMTFKDIAQNDTKKELNRIEKDRKSWRDDGTDYIRNNFTKLNGDFKAWHKEVCDNLIKIYEDGKLVLREEGKRSETTTNLTYGQAQKWLNMTLKYLWLLNRFGLINNKKDANIINTYEKNFHVPLDSYILRYVSKQAKNKKTPFSCENGLNPEYSFKEEWACFGSAWSQINNKDKYYDYQEKLAKAVENDHPLKWELEHWHKALKYYG